ncbi:hypothetical protein GCM10020331_026490 [Ectobacillus funiculus]
MQTIPAKLVWKDAPENIQTAFDALNQLQEMYMGSLAYEFAHVHHIEERAWLHQIVENGSLNRALSKAERSNLLKQLTEVEGFEQFFYIKTFVGQKRFSIEGVDMLVPMLDEMIREGVEAGVHNVLIGMAHRGRLSVLAHVLEKNHTVRFSLNFNTLPPNNRNHPASLLTSVRAGQEM